MKKTLYFCVATLLLSCNSKTNIEQQITDSLKVEKLISDFHAESKARRAGYAERSNNARLNILLLKLEKSESVENKIVVGFHKIKCVDDSTQAAMRERFVDSCFKHYNIKEEKFN